MSQSARMEQRFSKRWNVRRVAAVAYIISSIVYLPVLFAVMVFDGRG